MQEFYLQRTSILVYTCYVFVKEFRCLTNFNTWFFFLIFYKNSGIVLLKNDLLNVMLQIEEIISNVIENTNRSIKLNLTITYM
jgi:hypothetical protein